MRIRKKLDFFRLFLYILFGACSLFLRHVGDHDEPFSLALSYGMASAGLSPLISGILYILPYLIFPFNAYLPTLFLIFWQGFLLWIGFTIQGKLPCEKPKQTGFFTQFTLAVGLSLYVGFGAIPSYTFPLSPEQTPSPYVEKTIIAAATFLLSAIFSVALKALLKKSLRCRLRPDELLFSALLFALIGLGLHRFFGFNAYMGVTIFLLLLFAHVTKDATSLLCAFLFSLPPFLAGNPVTEKFFLIGVFIVLFSKAGRAGIACAALTAFFLYGYFDGLYAYPSNMLISTLLSILIPTLLFILLPVSFTRALEHKLVFYREKHLSRIAINRNRAAVGEKLFEISAVFREIEYTFSSLGDRTAEDNARAHIRARVLEESCKHCPSYPNCQKQNATADLDKLIEVGCLKGKTNLIDIPNALAKICINQSGILYAVNRHIGDYRKYLAEMENAACGRALLAKQAQGISEILKTLALEQSEPLKIYSEKERLLNIALLSAGIICSEVLIYGDEEHFTLSLVTFGKADVKKIAQLASQLFGVEMIISEKIALNDDKFCCILRKKPTFDAAFGVTSLKKSGSSASGDSHSVIKIDERRFMVTLADGMGSGEYAKRISENTVSLLESFYRAKMPSELVLSTVNKLLTFNKEERFACVDLAIVDLDNGNADIIKIGSPLGFILSGNTVKVLESASLPLGILESLRPDANSYALLENDVLLFLSDGVVDAFGSATDLYEHLRALPIGNPQQLTDGLLQAALRIQNGIAKDDMTAVAVRLFRNHVA